MIYSIFIFIFFRKITKIFNKFFEATFKITSYLPLNMLKKYVKFFEPNKLKYIILEIKEKSYYEEIINTIVSDYCFNNCR